MRGRLDRNMITLTGGQQETITITDLVIPQEAKSGMDLLLSLVVRKEDFRRKREAQVGGSSQSGGYGGGSVGGSSQNGGYGGGSVGGSSQNGGYGGGSVGGSSQNGGYNPGYNQGGSVGGNSQSGGNYNGGYNNGGSVGGSSQSGDYNPGFNNDNQNGGLNWNNNNNDPGYNDPSNKREVRSTVVFKVTDGTEADDDTDPWTAKEYGADSKDETCTNGPGEPGCDMEYWWVKFQIQDEESGLHLVDVRAASSSGKNPYENQIYYR